MRKELEDLLNRYVTLVKSGDAGQWDPEKEEVVIAAREALKKDDNILTLASTEMLKLTVYLPNEDDSWCGRKHVTEMLTKLANREIRGCKGHRWLGWAQCSTYMFGGIEGKKLADINKKAGEVK